MKKWAIVAGCAVAAAIAIWFTLFRPSEEDRVRKVLDRFAKAVAVKADDNILARTGRLRSELKETVTDDVYVDVSDLNIRVTSRGALVEDATKAGLVFQSADCSLTGMTIKIDDTATTAKVDALAVVTGERGGERRVDKRPVHFLLRKNDGEWRITTVDVAPARPD
ncbi:MAG TPA: nuclear transport factor 2 family protein [Labilithrix sp.]|nr:nuclear transport factor 2 family protein [Labilithrix sp.]